MVVVDLASVPQGVEHYDHRYTVVDLTDVDLASMPQGVEHRSPATSRSRRRPLTSPRCRKALTTNGSHLACTESRDSLAVAWTTEHTLGSCIEFFLSVFKSGRFRPTLSL